jgi:heme-degrading monooxygenase HmoA
MPMFARLTRYAGLPPERMEETLQEFRNEFVPVLEKMPGFHGLVVGVDYRSGKACALSLWESQEAMTASDEVASQARASAESRVEPSRAPINDHYEVVVEKMAS